MTTGTARTRVRTFTHDSLTFDVIDVGPLDGPAIIALHGFPERATSYRAMIPHLTAAGFRVLAPDQRGYSPGARPAGIANYKTGLLVADVLALADRAGLTTFHVLGHDWGATVAWELAATHPDRVRTVAALSVPNPRAFLAALPRGQIFRSWYMFVFQLPWLPERLMLALLRFGVMLRALSARDRGWVARAARQLVTRLPSIPVDEALALWQEPGAATAAVNWYRAMFYRTTTPPKVRVPTLYVWSTGDRYLGHAAAALTARYVEGPYRFEVLHGVSHWIPHERPVEAAAMVLAHIDECAGSEHGGSQ